MSFSLEREVESLGSLDKKGWRNFLQPSEVRGKFRRWRTSVYYFLILIFLILPWLKLDGQQLLLLNVVERKFSIFGLQFWGHDLPMVFFVLAIVTVGLALVTALFGRVWCGWGCPQTVFIDAVFRKIELWIEGNHRERISLQKAPLSFGKVAKKTLKWSTFFVASFIISHSFLAYFVGTDRVLGMITSSPSENWESFLFVFFVTGVTLFDFGWFREQFCIIMCPYGRFQSVLMDENSLAVVYDEKRGEPRKSKSVSYEKAGDCVNCFKCVAACPTGIDIRHGVQMECIACTACIDACDEVMEKVEKPKGLIRYSTESEISGHAPKKFRVRTALYSFVLFAITVGLVITLLIREPVDVVFIRATDTPYTVTEINNEIFVTNHFKVHLTNQEFETAKISLAVDSADMAEVVAPLYPLSLTGGEMASNHIFLRFPKSKTVNIMGRSNLEIEIIIEIGNQITKRKVSVPIVGPIS